MASPPFPTTYEYTINSWVPVAQSSHVAPAWQQGPQQQPVLPPQQPQQPQPPGSSVYYMQPCYMPSQPSVFLPNQPNNINQVYPVDQAPTSSQMFVMTPINSDANVTANSAASHPHRRITRRNAARESFNQSTSTRTVSCTATLPDSGSWLCKKCANSDSGSRSRSGRSRSRSGSRSRGVHRLHVNIRKATRPSKLSSRQSASTRHSPDPEDYGDCSSDSDRGQTVEDEYPWTGYDGNLTNNNLRTESNCNNHASCSYCAITTLVPKKSRKTARKKAFKISPRKVRRENGNNGNNNQRRLQQKHPNPLLNDARRIGAKLAGVPLPGMNENLRMTEDMTSEWETNDQWTSRSKRRPVASKRSTNYERDYQGNNAGRQKKKLVTNGRAGKYQKQTQGNNGRGINDPYTNRSGASGMERFKLDTEDVEDEVVMDYNNSADYRRSPIKYVSDLGPAQRIIRRDGSVVRKSNLVPVVASTNGTSITTVDVKGEDKHLQTVLAIQTSVFVTAVCYSLHLGCLAHLQEDVLSDRNAYQQIQHTVLVMQFLASYLFGRYCDVSGLYAALFVTYLTSALSYSLLSLAQDDYLIFASRILTVFVHNVEAGQIAICQTGTEARRSMVLGKVALAHSLGMKMGGLFNETLIDSFGVQDLALIISGVQCAGLLILMLTNFNAKTEVPKSEEKNIQQIISVQWLRELLATPRLLHLLMAQFCSSLAVYVFQGAFPHMAISYFHMSKEQLGFCLTYITLLTLATQSVGINFAVTFVQEEKLALYISLLLAVVYFLLMLVPSAVYVWLLVLPLSVAITLLNLILTSTLSKCGPPNSTGSVLGLNMMVVLLSKAMAPILITAVTSESNFADVAVLGLACSGLTCLLLFHDKNIFVLRKRQLQ